MDFAKNQMTILSSNTMFSTSLIIVLRVVRRLDTLTEISSTSFCAELAEDQKRLWGHIKASEIIFTIKLVKRSFIMNLIELVW